MKLAIITDSTCDLKKDRLEHLAVQRVPLYVNFKGEVFRDWLEITPKELIEGVQAGEDLPSTSQPSPQDFEQAYKAAVESGAEEILCITISSDLSGTYQSANIAKESVSVPVTVFDSRGASLGLGEMVIYAAKMRGEAKSLEEIISGLEHIRDSNFLRFSVASLEFLQKNGRIGGAGALIGSLLNIKPILKIENGRVDAAGRVRGAKKALKEMISQIKTYIETHPGQLVADFVHIMDETAADGLRQEMKNAGINFIDGGTHEMGAVIATHVGPGTYGVYLHTEPS